MEITTERIKELRDMTGVSIMQCKKALEEAGGDMEKAKILLQKQSAIAASKKGDRELGAGMVLSYVHSNGQVGALVELDCETDFVAKNPEFSELARDIAMHVTATNPKYVTSEEITEEEKERAKEVFQKDLEGKPAEMHEKIMEGKLMSYFKDFVLLEQPFIKNPDMTINGLLQSASQKFGEKIHLARFVRLGVLEE